MKQAERTAWRAYAAAVVLAMTMELYVGDLSKISGLDEADTAEVTALLAE